MTDPAPATTFAHLDATTVLSRAIAELGIYPAVDPLDSTSRIMDPNVIGSEHYNIARGVQKILQVWNKKKKNSTYHNLFIYSNLTRNKHTLYKEYTFIYINILNDV